MVECSTTLISSVFTATNCSRGDTKLKFNELIDFVPSPALIFVLELSIKCLELLFRDKIESLDRFQAVHNSWL